MNIAELPASQRTHLQADLTACRIRHLCRNLSGHERQRLALAELDKLDPEFRAAVLVEMKRRSSLP